METQTSHHSTQNVIVTLKTQKKNKIIIFCIHYILAFFNGNNNLLLSVLNTVF